MARYLMCIYIFKILALYLVIFVETVSNKFGFDAHKWDIFQLWLSFALISLYQGSNTLYTG